MVFHRCFRLFSVLCFLFISAKPALGNYMTNADTRTFIDELVNKHQFDRTALEEVFSQASQKESILKAISRPAEKRLEWKEYRKIFLKEGRIKKGKAFIEKYRDVLVKAEEAYGVSRYIVAAIIGVETYYGKNKGSYRVVDALSTLAFDYPPRSKFFRSELEHFLLMAREQRFGALDVKGSYAGAMGYGQFIPSSYRAYAVDFDGDGVADILENVNDAIGSVANYFYRHGWKRGEPVADIITPQGSVDAYLYNSLKPKHSAADLKAKGVNMQWPDRVSDNMLVKLLALQGAGGEEYWLTYENFYVITRYNHSPLYAMAVFQLAEAIRR